MGAEMDCCDATDDGRRFYVELKTSREVFFCMNCKALLSLLKKIIIIRFCP
jgi:hypothetical protein